MKSGVIGGWPTVPRMPSVPKYVLFMAGEEGWARSSACQAGGLPDGERIDGRRDVVDADDARAALDGGQRRGDARGKALADRSTGERAERRLARPADEERPADREQLALAPQQLEVVLRRLAETDPRVEHD